MFNPITREEGGLDLKGIVMDFMLAAVNWFRKGVDCNGTSASRRSGATRTKNKGEKSW